MPSIRREIMQTQLKPGEPGKNTKGSLVASHSVLLSYYLLQLILHCSEGRISHDVEPKSISRRRIVKINFCQEAQQMEATWDVEHI